MMDKSKTVILGSGVSGIGAVKLAQKKGLEIFLSDSKNIKSETKKLLSKLEVKYEESGHTENLIKDSNEIIISPGIDLRSLIKSKPSLKKRKLYQKLNLLRDILMHLLLLSLGQMEKQQHQNSFTTY